MISHHVVDGYSEDLVEATIRTRMPAGWDYRPAREIVDPELAHWVTRIEAAAITSSPDLTRAAAHELGYLTVLRRRSTRYGTAAIASLAAGAGVAVGVGWMTTSDMDQLSVAPIPAVLLHILGIGIAAVAAVMACRVVALTVTRSWAHRIVIARDRLDRWLPPLTDHPLITPGSAVGAATSFPTAKDS